MNGLFIDPVRVPIGQFEIDSEHILETAFDRKKKRMELVCDPNYVNDIIGILKHHFGENPENLFNNDSNLEAISNLNDMLNKALKWKEIGILGEYNIQNRNISYYLPDTYREIVEIHERYHALHHLMKDNDKNIWKNFGDVPPFYQELLAQLFTWNYINNFRRDLIQPFLDLNENQPFIYQTWRIFENYSEFQIERLYWEIRERVTKSQPLGMLGEVNKIIKTINHPLHKKVGEVFHTFFNGKPEYDVIFDHACNEEKYQNIPLFVDKIDNNGRVLDEFEIIHAKANSTEITNVDILVTRNKEVVLICEIEESNVKPNHIIGKFFSVALSKYWGNIRDKGNLVKHINEGIIFIQVLDTKNLKEKSNKVAQWRNIENAINSQVVKDDLFDKIKYHLIDGKLDDFSKIDDQLTTILDDLFNNFTNNKYISESL